MQNDNIIKITIEAAGECRKDISIPSCTRTLFTCEGYVRYVNGNYETHPGSSCQPKLQITVQDPEGNVRDISETFDATPAPIDTSVS